MFTKPERSAIIISASSDIGAALAARWAARGWRVSGTYRTMSAKVEELNAGGARLVECDLRDAASVSAACATLGGLSREWDTLVLAAGSLAPVGKFIETDFSQWEDSIRINFTAQLQATRELLPWRRKTVTTHGPCVLFFAGGGTNGAPVAYSAYTVSKIALIKMCELLDAEVPDTRFAILGPGWVKTKIHHATLKAGTRAGANYEKTLEHARDNDFTSMDRVLDCCDWIVESGRELVGGRNFSVVHDPWGTPDLANRLRQNPNMHKLRRRQ